MKSDLIYQMDIHSLKIQFSSLTPSIKKVLFNM